MIFGGLFRKLFSRPDFNEKFNKYFSERVHSTIVRYNARSDKYMDVRDVFWVPSNQRIEMMDYFDKVVEGITDNDVKALCIAKHINKRMTYVKDKINYGKPEFWADPYTIFKGWRDDCDGSAVLIVFAWGLVGIPAARRWVRAGDIFFVNGRFAGSHASAIYWSERFNEFYAVEGSFYARLSMVEFEVLPLRRNPRYGRSWFYCNSNFSTRVRVEESIWGKNDS